MPSVGGLFRRSGPALALALASSLSMQSGAHATATSIEASISATTDASVMQTLINQDRATNGGLPALYWSTCLANIALQNAQRIAAQGYLSHTDGPNLDLGCAAGATSAGENIGYVSDGINDAEMNTAYMNSAPHRANILGSYTWVATAWVVAPNGYGYSAEEFLQAPGPAPSGGPVPSTVTSMDTLDGWGGLHADGGAPSLPVSSYWPGWKIARSAALLPGGGGGYVLDGWGGLHPFGQAPAVAISAYWPGWNIARDVVVLPGSTLQQQGGYVLDGWGGLHPFGNAPAARVSAYWPGWDIAKRAALLSDGTGGYVLDGWGGLHPFAVGGNPMPPMISNNAYWRGWNIARDLSLTPGSTAANVSGVTMDGWGGVHPFGSAATPTSISAYWPNWDIARAVRLSPTSTPAAPQGWVLDGWGGLHSFGGAPAVSTGGYWPNWDIAVQLLVS